MSQVKSLGAGVREPDDRPCGSAKASRVKDSQNPDGFHALLSQILSRAGDRADYSSVQRFEFLGVPAFALLAKSARLANG
ncbi:hypothetical protein [Phenylobacterium sp.]|uniref:hypothetical protein n=1 Tax=Phenylobacterium sp. TaxID=1871053 RepID=UPI0035B06C3F